MQGYLRSDGRKGIRNVVAVAYLVECAHHVAREIAGPFRDRGVHLIGFPGCFPNAYAARIMERLGTHPNVGAVLLVSLGCESFDRQRLADAIRASGRPVETLVIQEPGGTRSTIEAGRAWVEEALGRLAQTRAQRRWTSSELVVGTICGGSDATSGLTANPAAGRAFDLLVDAGRGLHLRGDRRADRLRALHGRARRHARTGPRDRRLGRQGRPLLRGRSATAASPRATPTAA